jgi:predicted MFS family arabinose efflux permease
VSARGRTILLGVAIAVTLADSSVVTLALPDILRRYDISITTVAWVLTVYNLVLALAAVPAAHIARRRPSAVCAVGLVVFAAASLVCGFAPSFPVLLAGRGAQAVGGAAVVSAALALLFEVRGTEEQAARVWASAGILGAALGPAVGGVLTQVVGWESIFLVQAPLMLAGLAALWRLETPARPPAAAGRPHVAANLALLFGSAALSAALFLLVILLVNGWNLPPARAGLVVTLMPAAAIAMSRFAPRIGSAATRAVSGLILVAGGLAALGLLPHASWRWTVPPQLLVGAGLGLTVAALTEQALRGRSPQAVHGGWTIASRHAGIVLGLLVLTPLFSAQLTKNESEAKRAGTAVLLDSRIPPLEKISAAQSVLRAIDHAGGRLPDVRAPLEPKFNGASGSEYRRVAATLQDQLERAVTSAFGLPFLLAAAFAVAGVGVIAVGRRNPTL